MRLFTRKLTPKQKEALNRLADGIECGAKLRPQGFTQLFQSDQENPYAPRQWSSCAMGAAWECYMIAQGKPIDFAVDVGIGKLDYDDILKAYGVTLRSDILTLEIDGQEIGGAEREHMNLTKILWQLNDLLEWPREKITQFLRDAE